MADTDDEDVRDASNTVNAESDAVAPGVSWVPTVVMLGLFVWWVLLAFISRGRFPDLHDAARFVAYVLLGGVAIAAVPALVQQAGHKTSRGARIAAVLLIYATLAIPLCFGLFWSAYDSLTPIRVRPDGELPDTGSLICGDFTISKVVR